MAVATVSSMDLSTLVEFFHDALAFVRFRVIIYFFVSKRIKLSRFFRIINLLLLILSSKFYTIVIADMFESSDNREKMIFRRDYRKRLRLETRIEFLYVATSTTFSTIVWCVYSNDNVVLKT